MFLKFKGVNKFQLQGASVRLLRVNPSSAGMLIILVLPTECWDTSFPDRDVYSYIGRGGARS